jgi:transcriptional regulator with XRE-family HTH domain
VRVLSLQRRFGIRLKLVRLSKGLTQEQFAELCGVSTGLISNIERGINQPSFKSIELFCTVLKVEARELFDFSAVSEFQKRHGVSLRARAPRGSNKRSIPPTASPNA